MTTDTSMPPYPSNNAYAEKRDEYLLWFLDHHPATVSILVTIEGLFPNRCKARKRLLALVRRKKLRLLGSVQLTIGRPEHVYGRGRWKTDNLFHEVQLTRVCLQIHADDIKRGPGKVDSFLLPDAELFIRGERYFLEMDCGTMSVRRVVENRFTKYESSSHFVFWICPDQRRMEALRRQAQMIRGVALFTTLDQALEDPHAPIWVDADGKRAALPRKAVAEPKQGQ